MKVIIRLLTILLLVATANAASIPSTDFSTNQTIKLRWTYPSNELSTNLTFVLFSTTNLVQDSNTVWNVMTNIPGTVTNCEFSMLPGQMFFRLVASNFWGLCSDPSNTVSTERTPKDTGKPDISKKP